jgi:hypothetical protein
MTASSTDEVAKEGKDHDCSVFTHHIVNGLRSGIASSSGVISYNELYNYVNQKVAEEVNQSVMQIVQGEGTVAVGYTRVRSEPFVRPSKPRPKQNARKRLIICFDCQEGTQRPTNVAKFHAALSSRGKDDRLQLSFYQKRSYPESYLDGLIGAAYGFLIRYFEPGDSIYILAGSREAIAAMALAGVLRTGISDNGSLLRPLDDARNRVQQRLWAEAGATGSTNMLTMRDPAQGMLIEMMAKCQRCVVSMIGLWEPVRVRNGLNSEYAGKSPDIRVEQVFQALAIDERKRRFRPPIWSDLPNLVQVWFSGGHADVFGGAASTGLSDLPLNWMIKKSREKGLDFNEEYERGIVHPDPLAPAHVDDPFFGGWRKIGLSAAERVHTSADQRRRSMADYRPKNLISALERSSPTTIGD